MHSTTQRLAFPPGCFFGDVSAPRGSLTHGVGVVSLVGAEVLPLSLGRPRTLDGNASQCLTHQGLIVRIGAVDHHGNRDALPIGERRPLDAQLAAIRWVFPGFFPRPTAPSSSSVNAGQKAWRRTVEKRGARDDRRLYCNSKVKGKKECSPALGQAGCNG